MQSEPNKPYWSNRIFKRTKKIEKYLAECFKWRKHAMLSPDIVVKLKKVDHAVKELQGVLND